MLTWLFCTGYRELGKNNDLSSLCDKKLLRFDIQFSGEIEIKCSRCKTINLVHISNLPNHFWENRNDKKK